MIREKETRARRALSLGAALVLVGVLLAGTIARDAGGVLTLLGWGVAVYGLHAFGRVGRAGPADLAP